MRLLSLAGLLLVVTAPLACVGDDAPVDTAGAADGGDEPGARVLAQVDLLDRCGVIGATNVFLRATRVACAGGPLPPCTVPSDPYEVVIGDTAGCPNSQTAATLRLILPKPGRYQVEAVTVTGSGSVGLCYAVAGGLVEVDDAAVASRAEIVASPQIGPCPDP